MWQVFRVLRCTYSKLSVQLVDSLLFQIYSGRCEVQTDWLAGLFLSGVSSCGQSQPSNTLCFYICFIYHFIIIDDTNANKPSAYVQPANVADEYLRKWICVSARQTESAEKSDGRRTDRQEYILLRVYNCRAIYSSQHVLQQLKNVNSLLCLSFLSVSTGLVGRRISWVSCV